jgi:hypothetical protein
MSTEHGCCVIIPREDGYIRSVLARRFDFFMLLDLTQM